MKTLEDVWGKDWKEKIYDRVRARGFKQMRDYLANQPTATYHQLADQLGEDVAPVQLTMMHVAEAHADGAHAFREAAKDCLVRYLRERLPLGWGRVPLDQRELTESFMNTKAFVGWESSIEEVDRAMAPYIDGVWDQLQELAINGWLPEGADDEVIRRAFDAAWPVAQ